MNISDELHRRLKLYCVEHGVEMTEVVLKLVEDLLEKEARKKKT